MTDKPNKNCVVISLFSKNTKKLLLFKRNKKSYPNMWNGIVEKMKYVKILLKLPFVNVKKKHN